METPAGTPLQSGTTAGVTTGTEKKPEAATDEVSFQLPGGSGYAPLNFTPGQGHFDRKPLSFSTSIQQGYDDNVDASSGKAGTQPIKGSFITTASEGVDILLAQSRVGLSLGANLGGQYYWDREGDKLTPNGGLNILFAYKLTPQAQFSAIVNSIYTTQPTLTTVNGLTQSNNKGYLLTNSKFDLLYRWSPRFSTDTFYTANGAWYQDSNSQAGNYIDNTIGQSFRYAFSQIVTGVLEGRYSMLQYKALPNGESSLNDADTYYALVGADVTLSRRLSASIRVGETTRNYQTAGISTSSSPYAEGSLNYTISRTSLLALDARYGFDDGGSGSQGKSVRTGLSFTQALSSRLRASAGVNYTHINGSDVPTGLAASDTQDAVSATLGAQYAYSKSLTFFGNVNRIQNFSSVETSKYSKDIFYLGATYQY